MSKVDLHLHSTASDGRFSPADVVGKAAELGLTVIALAAIMIMLLLLNVPVIGMINNNASEAINQLSELTLKQMDDNTYEVICNINDSLYTYPIRDLNELQGLFNVTGMEVVVNPD